ncbi:MAG TPA: KpsF/GutQ family sugar-phosphate isomerase [Candidatus Marinimicrobia bacterium]|nr:KpsF/GutQ family sugar-phosphate isomerase [Candidatus Neomarinimicrobiota bacterium]
MAKNKINGLAQSILESESTQLRKVAKQIDKDVIKASNLIAKHDGKVVVCGLGKSGLIAQKIVATLCSTGTKSVFMHASDALHGDLGIYNPGDPTILISKSGNTEELIRLIPILREFDSPLIGIVSNMNSFIAKNVDIVLNGTIDKEVDPLGIVPTASALVAMAIGDALASVLMVKRGFKEKDFAKYHPGGQLGKQLGLVVKDVMHPVREVAILKENSSLSDVAILMTKKPLGAGLFLGKNKTLVGIITEGDIRKAIAFNNKTDDSINVFINRSPVTVSSSMAIHDAMKLMEDRQSQISVLPVVDNKKCVGLLRLHDLYQTKLL